MITTNMTKNSSRVVILLFFIFPFSLYAADDMWKSVFTYQQKMANYGQPEAQVKLGEMYEEGHGVEQSFDIAEQWYKKALAQDFHPAQGKLSQLQQHRQRAAAALQESQRAAKRDLASEKAESARMKQEQAERKRLDARKSEAKAMARRNKQQAVDNTKALDEERIARQRAQEAMAEMLATPDAFDED